MPAFLIAPTEPDLLKALGFVSWTPEKFGADVLFGARGVGLVGIQRKEIHDLVGSVRDGRLAKEVAQLEQVKLAFLLVEGRPRFSTDGVLMDRHCDWTREQFRGLLRSVQRKGITVEFTEDVADTVSAVEGIARWVEKGEHLSLERRPKTPVSKWGQRTHEGFASHILQSIDGIGPVQAKAILKHFGSLPLRWTVSAKEMGAVKGLGPKKVEAMGKAVEFG